MWSFLVGKQVYLLTLFDHPGICILFYTIAKLICMPVKIVLVMDYVVSSLFTCGDRIDRDDLPNSFSSIHKCRNDQSVSPEESKQSKRCENGSNDREEESGLPFKQGINSVDRPAGKDHDEKVLGQIICGNDLKECRGGLLHNIFILSGRAILPVELIDFPSLFAASILPSHFEALSLQS
jgi:hypothetical protein